MELETKIKIGYAVVGVCWLTSLVIFLFFLVRLIAQNV